MKYLQLLLAAAGTARAALDWQNVRIGGGGGFVPSIVFHPNAKGVAYARTDIGGIYRWNSDDSWTPITDYIAQNDTWYADLFICGLFRRGTDLEQEQMGH